MIAHLFSLSISCYYIERFYMCVKINDDVCILFMHLHILCLYYVEIDKLYMLLIHMCIISSLTHCDLILSSIFENQLNLP